MLLYVTLIDINTLKYLLLCYYTQNRIYKYIIGHAKGVPTCINPIEIIQKKHLL